MSNTSEVFPVVIQHFTRSQAFESSSDSLITPSWAEVLMELGGCELVPLKLMAGESVGDSAGAVGAVDRSGDEPKVAWGITPIIVGSVKVKSRLIPVGQGEGIGKERLSVVKPWLVHLDPSTTVVAIGGTSWHCASADHS